MHNLQLTFKVFLLLAISSLMSCSKDDDSSETTSLASETIISASNVSGTPEGDINNTGVDEDDKVENSSFTQTVTIVYSGSTATITNPAATSGVTITQNGAQVTVQSTIAGVSYEVSGTTTNGSLKIYSDKKFKLTLTDASITNPSGPAINIQSEKTAFVIVSGTNTLTDATSYSNIPTDEDAKGTLFSEGQLVFSGSGTLNVAGKYKHAIVSDDYIRVREGKIVVSQAVSDGLHANNYIIVDGGTLQLTVSSDGIDCEEGYIIINNGTFTLNTTDDGIAASYDITEETTPDATITPNVTINGGTFSIKTTEGEGIESKGSTTINGGNFTINAADDGINSIGKLYINGGDFYVVSSSNDAIDANDSVTITGGTIIAIGSRTPEAGIDNDSKTLKITGGTLLALGGSSAKPTASVSTQNSVIFAGTAANTLLHIRSNDNSEALTYLIPSQVGTILYSSNKLTTGKTYTLYTGGSVTNGTEWNGLYQSGTYSGGNSTNKSFTVNSSLTQIGGSIAP